MPAVSQAQAGFMGAVASGKQKQEGLSPDKAKEYLRGVKVSKLPKRVGKPAGNKPKGMKPKGMKHGKRK